MEIAKEKLAEAQKSLFELMQFAKDKVHSALPSKGEPFTLSNQSYDATFEVVSPYNAMAEQSARNARNELIAKILASAASIGLTVFAVNYMVNAMDPTRKEKKKARERAEAMMARLGVSKDIKLSDYELCIAANLVDPSSMNVSWDNIGGLEDIISEIQDTVIFPFRRSDLFPRSQLVQPPKGVLLYGPPGCGKTMIAKATAKAAGARFINLQISSLVDKWYGESQKRAEAVFSLALKLQPCIIFIDEIDSFLRSRSGNDHEATLMIKTQFMSFWDGLITDPRCHVMIMGATNRPQDVDAAILRRMPCSFRIGKPGNAQRSSIIELTMENEETSEDIDYDRLGTMTEGFSGSDLKEACRVAATNRIHSYVTEARRTYGDLYCDMVQTGMRDINMSDMEFGVNKILASKCNLDKPITNIQLD